MYNSLENCVILCMALWYDQRSRLFITFMYIALSVNQDILSERVKVDRRRIEEAFFQYALLRVTLWYPDQLSMSTLPLHNKTMEILPRIVSIYHGAFMKRHAGNYIICTINYKHDNTIL